MDALERPQRSKPALNSVKSTGKLTDRETKSTSPIAAKPSETVNNRDLKPTSPIDPYKCGGCAQLYNDSDRLPMVLPCGHRNCRKCMYGTLMPRSRRPTCAVCHERSILIFSLLPVDTARLEKITTRRLLLEDLEQTLGKVKEAEELLTFEGVDKLVQRLTSAMMKEIMEQLSRENFDKATSTEVTEFCASNKEVCDDLRSRRNAPDGAEGYSEDLHVVMQESGIPHISKFCVGGGTYSYCHLCRRPIPSDSKSYQIHIEGRGHMCAREQYEKKMSTIRDDVNPSSSLDRLGYYRDVIGGMWIKIWR